MPELPEVEVARLAIEPRLAGRRLTRVIPRVPALRYPLPANLNTLLAGQTLNAVERRGKYLLFDFGSDFGSDISPASGHESSPKPRFGAGRLLLHLGMSGSLRLVPARLAPEKHDHVDLVFGTTALRLRDPRRFGALLWVAGDAGVHPLLARLGMEPLTRAFTASWLATALAGRRAAIKSTLMDASLVVGIGNIYASESLFRAGIDPRRPAAEVTPVELARLVPAIKQILRAAIAAGGSTLRDHAQANGEIGYFQVRHRVYDRGGQACTVCGSPIQAIRQGQRSTYFCPRCQR